MSIHLKLTSLVGEFHEILRASDFNEKEAMVTLLKKPVKHNVTVTPEKTSTSSSTSNTKKDGLYFQRSSATVNESGKTPADDSRFFIDSSDDDMIELSSGLVDSTFKDANPFQGAPRSQSSMSRKLSSVSRSSKHGIHARHSHKRTPTTPNKDSLAGDSNFSGDDSDMSWTAVDAFVDSPCRRFHSSSRQQKPHSRPLPCRQHHGPAAEAWSAEGAHSPVARYNYAAHIPTKRTFTGVSTAVTGSQENPVLLAESDVSSDSDHVQESSVRHDTWDAILSDKESEPRPKRQKICEYGMCQGSLLVTMTY